MSRVVEDDAYKAFRDLARDLESKGVDPVEIADALLVLGINGGARLGGNEHMADFLEKTAGQVRAGHRVSGTRH